MKKGTARTGAKSHQVPTQNNWGLIITTIFVVIFAGIGVGNWLGKKSLYSSDPSIMFPGFLNRLNDAAIVRVHDDRALLTFTRLGDSWFVNGYDGLPVDANRLREQLLNLARIKIIEPKTRDSQLYRRLHVADPGAKMGAAKAVTVLGQDERVLMGLLIGKPDHGAGGRLSRNFFARRVGEAQAWLVQGMVAFPMQAESWLDRDFFHVEPRRLKSITWGKGMEVQRTSPFMAADAEHWKILEFLHFIDVAPKEKALTQTSISGTLTAQTFDGMTVALKAHQSATDNQVWITLEADWRPAPSVDAWKLTKEKETIASTVLRSPAQVKTEVEVLRRMGKAWAFRVPETSLTKLFPTSGGANATKGN
jgi:hypothetical protein